MRGNPMNDDRDGPDFAALYEPGFAAGGALTPRLAWVLCNTAWYPADEWRLVADDHDVRRRLPRVAHHYATREWQMRFGDCFERLARRIAAGEGDTAALATCTAEELALHMILRVAPHLLEAGLLDEDAVADLPDHGGADRDVALLDDALFEDHDVLLLYQADLDGIERAPGLLGRTGPFVVAACGADRNGGIIGAGPPPGAPRRACLASFRIV
jgi:hypothetical protein